MPESAEHQFISQTFERVVDRLSGVRLFGVSEAERRTFDYACVLHRDFSRPLVSQVLWKNVRGIDKDLRTLLHDKEAIVKLYFVADTVPTRVRLDEILSSYRSADATKSLLRGLKIVFVPSEFNADKEANRAWMKNYLEDCVSKDLFLRTLFGHLTQFQYSVFVDHGGPLGLKYAILHEISENGLYHTPSFKERLGYKTDSPIREAITMLSALGLIHRINNSVCCVPTIKGRFVLDLARLVMFEATTRSVWSDETAIVLQILGVPTMPECQVPTLPDRKIPANKVARDLLAINACSERYGRRLLSAEIDEASPKFHSTFDWRKFAIPQEVPADYTKWFRDHWFHDDLAIAFPGELADTI